MNNRPELGVVNSPEFGSDTHTVLEDAILGHMSRSGLWDLYADEAASNKYWEAAAMYVNDPEGGVPLMCAFLSTPMADVESGQTHTFYVNTAGQMLAEGGRSQWLWQGCMTPDEKEAAAPLSASEMNALLHVLHEGRPLHGNPRIRAELEASGYTFFPGMTLVGCGVNDAVARPAPKEAVSLNWPEKATLVLAGLRAFLQRGQG